MKILDAIKKGWDVLTGNDIPYTVHTGAGTYRPSHTKSATSSFRSSIVTNIFNRIAIDVSMINILHVKVDETGNERIVHSTIHECLNTEANIDQSHRDFIHDLVYSMFDEPTGIVAIVPTITREKPDGLGSFDILSMRVGKIVKWFPTSVSVEVYDEMTGKRVVRTLPKAIVGIIENPFKEVLSSENSTLKRLIDKISLLDISDREFASNTFNLIIQTPQSIKTEVQRKMVLSRLNEIQLQLSSGQYGIAYIDGSEKITQLNRPIPPQLLDQIKDLSQELHNQLGLTKSVFTGTATEIENRNYYTRAIDVILDKIVSELRRKFLTKTARSQGHTFVYRRDPLKLLPVEQMAGAIDTYLRNALMSPNEARKLLGFPPDPNPKSDELYNRNIADVNQNGIPDNEEQMGDMGQEPQPNEGPVGETPEQPQGDEGQLMEILKSLGISEEELSNMSEEEIQELLKVLEKEGNK